MSTERESAHLPCVRSRYRKTKAEGGFEVVRHDVPSSTTAVGIHDRSVRVLREQIEDVDRRSLLHFVVGQLYRHGERKEICDEFSTDGKSRLQVEASPFKVRLHCMEERG